MAKILLVEDEPDFAVLITALLASDHHSVECVDRGEIAVEALRCQDFDCLILDWNLPGMSGLEVCQSYRDGGGRLPIMMLTSRNHVDDKSAGLDAGADDYLTKPFEQKEFLARVRALLRRPAQFSGKSLKAGQLEMDVANHRVSRGDETIQFLPREFALLEFFMRHPHQVYSAEQLIDRVWLAGEAASPETIRTYIKRLRKKLDLEGHPSMFATVHGVGYKFEGPA